MLYHIIYTNIKVLYIIIEIALKKGANNTFIKIKMTSNQTKYIIEKLSIYIILTKNLLHVLPHY